MLDYTNKVILAPMVRIGTLPMRLLALRYGADIVYTEELIDWKFLRSKRISNDILNTVDYVDQTDGTIVFRTCAEEKNKVVLQLGTCDAVRALKVGKLVTQEERPQHAVHPDIILYVAERISVPVIANGGSKEIEKFSDINKFKTVTGCSSVMIARAAEWNCSIFRKEGLLPMDDVIREYLKLSVDYDNSPSNTKYCVQNILRDLQETPRGRQFLDCQTLEQICSIWDLREYCKQKQSHYHKMGIQGRWQVSPSNLEPPQKKLKSVDMDLDDVSQMKVCFIRANFNDLNLPKTQLHTWAGKNGLKLPVYETQQIEKLFRTIITFDGKRYTSTFWEKNKKFAEQSAALVCLYKLGLVTEEQLIILGSVIK
ncbi:tRNA-dihydrouridine(20) synthase [NAD(P)+]-like isoform X3 [Plodia interpunctella]|uniref:tRNA-dihydrouridine(20) synthase [NAD(P)+]-like isoform X3 n=1 Tax=Plodia interpunctella TaxID=58824 RepID=UPI00236756E0|nr:tRNA-dihydrouridine(20) synthase [NAD(P)+]-like isoform X3 [Plodia interpunctella]